MCPGSQVKKELQRKGYRQLRQTAGSPWDEDSDVMTRFRNMVVRAGLVESPFPLEGWGQACPEGVREEVQTWGTEDPLGQGKGGREWGRSWKRRGQKDRKLRDTTVHGSDPVERRGTSDAGRRGNNGVLMSRMCEGVGMECQEGGLPSVRTMNGSHCREEENTLHQNCF